jgi:hypothetical protein
MTANTLNQPNQAPPAAAALAFVFGVVALGLVVMLGAAAIA